MSQAITLVISDESTSIHYYPCLKSINSTLGSPATRPGRRRRVTLPHHEGSPESNHDVRRELSGFAKQRRARARARRAQDDGECAARVRVRVRYPATSRYTYLSLSRTGRRTDDGRRHGLERVTSLSTTLSSLSTTRSRRRTGNERMNFFVTAWDSRARDGGTGETSRARRGAREGFRDALGANRVG
jgi:hypothetical protein